MAGAGGRSFLFSADVPYEILVRRAHLIYSCDVGVPLAIGSFSEPITDIFAFEVRRAAYKKQNCTKNSVRDDDMEEVKLETWRSQTDRVVQWRHTLSLHNFSDEI